MPPDDAFCRPVIVVDENDGDDDGCVISASSRRLVVDEDDDDDGSVVSASSRRLVVDEHDDDDVDDATGCRFVRPRLNFCLSL